MIPPLTLRQTDGRMIRAWDFKQKRNLVIAFLDVGCSICERFLRTVTAHAEEFRQREAVVLLVFLQQPGPSACGNLPAEIIAGMDVSGSSARRFLGEDALSTPGLARRGVFVTDRYGELYDQWIAEEHEFPAVQEILSSLDGIELACDECGVSHWPIDE